MARYTNHKWPALLFPVFLCFYFTTVAQVPIPPCTNPWQTPTTAFPVCGNTVFVQTNVPICQYTGGGVSSCSVNPINCYFYKFTVFTSGTLGFLITPLILANDYDFALFEVTNATSPNEIYTNPAFLRSGNTYFFMGGTTGCAAGGSPNICGGTGPLNALQNVIAGQKYLLMVVNYNGNGAGYTLNFTGGTASITQTQPVNFLQAVTNCANNRVTVKLNQPIKCTSLAADGSDFSISPAVGIIAATSPDCSTGQFSTDSIVLQLSGNMAPGVYTVSIQNGTDGNTLLGICNDAMIIPQTISFTVSPVPPPPVFSQVYTPVCAPGKIKFKLTKPVLCDSVAPDGSDYIITGPANVSITGVNTFCSGNPSVTTDFELIFNGPVTTSGLYTITAKNGSDNNTAVDLCGLIQPDGDNISFSIVGSVDAVFTYSIHYGCLADTVFFNHPGNGAANWLWDFGDPGSGVLNSSILQNPVHIYNRFGNKNITLAVANGFCNSNTTQVVNLDNEIIADFTITPSNAVCLNNGAVFKSTASGINLNYEWNFDNGQFSNIQNPPAVIFANPGTYTVTHRIINNYNCSASIQKSITVLPLPTAAYSVDKVKACTGEPLSFAFTTATRNSYVWDFGDGIKDLVSVKPVHRYLQPGNYITSLKVNNGFCESAKNEIPITIFEIPVVELGNDIAICSDNTIRLTAGTDLRYSYLWNTGEITPAIVYGNASSKRIEVTVTNGVCIIKDAINIKLLTGCNIAVPNAFTPNNDGKNDVFKILKAELVKDFRLEIFNRFGQKIFETSNPLAGWDGTQNGAKLNQGVYTWILRFKEDYENYNLLRGTVMLMR